MTIPATAPATAQEQPKTSPEPKRIVWPNQQVTHEHYDLVTGARRRDVDYGQEDVAEEADEHWKDLMQHNNSTSSLILFCMSHYGFDRTKMDLMVITALRIGMSIGYNLARTVPHEEPPPRAPRREPKTVRIPVSTLITSLFGGGGAKES